MRLRPYIESKDFACIAGWIGDERSHALWCANHFPYPVTAPAFRRFLQQTAAEWTACPFVVTDDAGTPVGFFRYSVNTANDEGFLASVIVDARLRGQGYGRQMLRLALRYAFEMTGAKLVQLYVFGANTAARRCYERVGFAGQSVEKGAFVYRDEVWDRCHMTITRADFI